MLTAAPLAALDGVRHGFFTREDGVSEGVYASLNCGTGSGDRPAPVRENRRRAAERLGRPAESLVTLHQVHSARAVRVSAAPASREAAPKADGMVTDRPGIVLGILTADCVPVLLADAGNGIVGAAHAGWKGALAGVVENTVAAMVSAGARRESVVAATGPCIGPDSYQVGPELRERFVGADAGSARHFRPDREPGRYLFDLRAYVRGRLERAGIGEIAALAHDTCADEARFFSYRRACHRGESDYGRGLSAIVLSPQRTPPCPT